MLERIHMLICEHCTKPTYVWQVERSLAIQELQELGCIVAQRNNDPCYCSLECLEEHRAINQAKREAIRETIRNEQLTESEIRQQEIRRGKRKAKRDSGYVFVSTHVKSHY